MSKKDNSDELTGCGFLIFLVILIFWFNPFNILGEDEIDTDITSQSSLIVKPDEQLYFEKNISNFISEYDNAQNDIKKSQLYVQSREFQTEFYDSLGFKIDNWVGKITSMNTEKGGESLSIFKVSNGDINYLIAPTLGDGLSMLQSNCRYKKIVTGINQGTDVYNSLVDVKKGDIVYFSGTFFRSDDDRVDRCFNNGKIQNSNKMPGYKEISVTEKGYMNNPEFLFRFSSILPYQNNTETED